MRYLLYFVFIIVLTSCLRLDDMLFNPDNSISEYLFENYKKGELSDLNNNSDWKIEDIYINPLTLSSTLDNQETSIKAVYIGDLKTIKNDTVLLYCHGNKWHMDVYWNRAKLLTNIGKKNKYGVLMFDYRGYGLSEGKSTETSLYADTDACLKWLKQQGVSSERLIIYGYSLGSAGAVEVSQKTSNYNLTPSKLILEAPFASSETMVQDAALLNLPSSYFTNIKIDNVNKIKNVVIPILWLHGTDDDFLQINTHGEKVYQNYQGQFKEAHRVIGAVHNNIPSIMGYNTYIQTLEKFIVQ